MIIWEVIVLVFIFTAMAFIFDVHGRNNIYVCIMTHCIALIIALFLSKIIYDVIHAS